MIRSWSKLSLIGAIWLVAGCQPQFSIEQIKRMMPQRPVALDRLEMMTGTWKTEGTIEMFGVKEPLQIEGTNTASWSCERRLLIDESTFDMDALGPMTGVSLWTYHPGKKKYLMWWFDSFGESAKGSARFNEKTSTWKIKTRGKNQFCSVVNHGTIRQIDENTLEWTWVQWDAFHILRYAKMHGISRRQQSVTIVNAEKKQAAHTGMIRNP